MPTTIDSITVKGFKSIRSIEDFQLRSINVMIGANGAGKSNFIEIFSLLRAINSSRALGSYVRRAGGAERLLHFGSRITKEIQLFVSFTDETERYEVSLAPTADDLLYRRLQPVDYLSRARHLRDHINTWCTYHFHHTNARSRMRTPSKLTDNRYLLPDGSNLAAFLYRLRSDSEGSYNQITNTIQKAAPFFVDFVLEPLLLEETKIQLEWRHLGSDAYFDAAALSDGTLRLVALTTLLLQPEWLRPSVILLDEPELGLHPLAISLLASMIRQASVETQVIVATQSPILLDHFEPEEVIVADRENGATRLTRLASAELEDWLENYSLGQLWEKNEIGGRPARE